MKFLNFRRLLKIKEMVAILLIEKLAKLCQQVGLVLALILLLAGTVSAQTAAERTETLTRETLRVLTERVNDHQKILQKMMLERQRPQYERPQYESPAPRTRDESNSVDEMFGKEVHMIIGGREVFSRQQAIQAVVIEAMRAKRNGTEPDIRIIDNVGFIKPTEFQGTPIKVQYKQPSNPPRSDLEVSLRARQPSTPLDLQVYIGGKEPGKKTVSQDPVRIPLPNNKELVMYSDGRRETVDKSNPGRYIPESSLPSKPVVKNERYIPESSLKSTTEVKKDNERYIPESSLKSTTEVKKDRYSDPFIPIGTKKEPARYEDPFKPIK